MSEHEPITPANWIEEANKLALEKKLDDALDIVYSSTSNLALANNYPLLNQTLQGADIPSLELDIMLGLVISSRRYRKHLPIYANLKDRVYAALKARNEDAAEILKNL